MGVAFLLSGQGAQKPGMGAALIEQGAPEVAETFTIASEAFGLDVADVCLNASAETLRDTAFAQPAMCTLSVAVAKALEARGVRPAYVAGFSLGQIAALAVSGMVSERDAFRIAAFRAKVMAEAAAVRPGSMCALLGGEPEEASEVCSSAAQGDVLVSLPWGYIGTASVLNAVLIVVRLVACAVPLFLVFYVTKLTDMANALVKVLHVPYKYAFTFMSTVHFIPVFMNDMAGIMEAQTARGVEFDGGLVKKVCLMIPLCVPLLVSSVRKTNSAAIAAEVRGFNLRTCGSGFKEYPFSGTDFAAMGIAAVLLIAAILLGVLF